MRSGLMVAGLTLVLAARAVAGQSAAARVYVQAAGAGYETADSAADVKKLLAEAKPNSRVALASSREEADLVLEIKGRHTEDRKNTALNADWIYSILNATLLDGERLTPLTVETDAMIKSWTTAADLMVTEVARYVEQNHYTLLRRRADWPAVGIEFAELTKERKKQFGIKDGKVVLTEVAPGGAGEKAGLRAGDVIATVDGEKLKNPVTLARAIYTRTNATLALGVMQGGSARTVSLTVP
jgi:C-terminal processing protease CtpA/Prc